MTLRFAASSLTPKSGGPRRVRRSLVSVCVWLSFSAPPAPDQNSEVKWKRMSLNQNSEVKWKRMSLKFSCARARA